MTLAATATSALAVAYASNSAAVCTVAGNSVTLLTPGTCSITANQAGNATFVAAAAVTQTFAVTALGNVITFPKPADRAVNAGPVTLAATASSGLAVAYASNSAAVCTVAGNSVSLVSFGTCSITATQPGNATIVAATPVTQTFAVTALANVITLPTPPATPVTTGTVTLPPTSSAGLPVTYVSATPGVCTVSGNVVTLLTGGTCTVTGSQAGNGNFAAATPVTVSFSVIQPFTAPTVASFTVNVPYASLGQPIELSNRVTGNFTSVALATAAAKGVSSLAGTIVTYRPARGFSGNDSFTYTAIGPGGTSAPGTVTINVGQRPDPSQDPDVQGLVKAEVAALSRFGQTQTENINRRLETLHDDNVDPVTNGVNFSQDNSLPAGLSSLEDLRRNDPTAASKSLKAINSAFPDAKLQAKAAAPNPSQFYFWTGGSIVFGSASRTGTVSDNRFTTSGVTAGVDTKWVEGLKVGLAVGYGADRTNVGVNGTRASSNYYSANIYASYRLMPKTFLDATLGYGGASFDTRRFIVADGTNVFGKRNGTQVFGSLTLTHEQKWGALKFAPYIRLDVAQLMLGASTETGSDIWALRYSKLNQSTAAGVLGLRALYPIDTGWGVLTPLARFEYRHAFDGSYRQALNYADQPGGPVYNLVGFAAVRDLYSGALGFQAMTSGRLSINAEYQVYLSSRKVEAQALRAIVAVGF